MSQVSILPEPGSRSKRFCGIRPTTFILSPGLSIVAAGVGGSLALKGTHGYATLYISSTGYRADQIQQCWHSGPTSLSLSVPLLRPHNQFHISSYEYHRVCLANERLQQASQYILSTTGRHIEYNVYCGAHFLTVFVYIFNIETCASFYYQQTEKGTQAANATCYAVVCALDFHQNPQDLGEKCFLKMPAASL